MTSEKQISANRLNAQKSTGPRTPEGKAAVSQNAFVHGLRSRQLLLACEDPAEYRRLAADFEAEWQPATPTEAALVEQMVVSLWKMQRLDGLERRTCVDIKLLSDLKMMDSLWRQQARTERPFHKAIEQLQRLRKASPAVQPQPSQTREDAQAAASQVSLTPAPPPRIRPVLATPAPVTTNLPTPPLADLTQQSQLQPSAGLPMVEVLAG